MGACATKPKVLKDGDEKPVSQPEPPPQKEEEEEVVQREAENDAAVAPIESPAKNPSLGNLFIKESEDAKVSPGSESEKENAANSSKENEAIKAPDEVARGKNTEALENLPAPVVEKEAIKAPEIIAKEALPAAPTTTMADHVPVEKEAAIKAPDEIIAKENSIPVALLDKFPEPSATTMADDAVVVEKDDANNEATKNDATAIEKMDSQSSEIVPEDFADALPAPASPVVNANANASENVKENVGEKSIAGSLEKIPSPPQPADTEEACFPTVKIVSQFSEEYTDALPDDAPNAEKVAVVLDDNNTNALQNIDQSEEKEVEEKSNLAQDAKPLNIEGKKTVEEDAVEKQIEVAESINPTQESDTKKQVKSVEILPEK